MKVLLFFLLWQLGLQDGRRPSVEPLVLEARIFDAINAERAQHRLKPLKVNPKLTDLARAQSRDMARRGFFDHVNPEGKSPADRARAVGLRCQRPLDDLHGLGLGENIFQNNLYDRVVFHNDRPTYEWKSVEEIAMSTVQGWLNSSGHREIILTPAYVTTGVGVAIAANDQVLITQEFC